MKPEEQAIVIVGASGTLGKILCKQALERGFRVRAFLRHSSRFRLQHPKLERTYGDVRDRSSLERAVTGAHAVLCVLGHQHYWTRPTLLSEGTANIIQAMQLQQVRRLLCVTAMGIGDNRYRLGLYYSVFTEPLILWRYFRDKERQEVLVRDSGLEYTLVRPAQFIPGKARKSYKVGVRLGSIWLTRLVSRATVASFLMQALEQREYVGQTVCITH